MSDRQDINAIFDRIAKRDFTDEDIQTLRQSIVGAVAIGGNADGSTIVTGDDNILGDNNTVQIGKYNINIAEGSNVKIGDTIYQGAGAEAIREILQELRANKVIIDRTLQRLEKSDSSGVDWDWGMKLLKQKQLPEIRKRLTDTLGRDRILMDVSIEEQQSWVNRSPLSADRILQINGENYGTLDANKMLIETFGRDDIEGKLLILGAPGAGKTTALLSLAEQLVYGAISQPRTVIPVIFELSTWQNDNQSIQSWLIEQLYDLHGGNRKSKLYEQWLERQVLLPLLDGLDELGLERQKKCTEKLNEFAEHYPQLVVCCRVKEFEAVDINLRNLRGAVCLQSLSDSQIQDYLGSLKRPELWGEIQTTPYLQAMLETTTEGDPGLLRVPLFVKLVADVYDPQQPISSKADLLDKYIDRQLSFDKREIDRRKELNEYQWAYKTVKLEPDWKKTCYTLKWMARNLQTDNKVEFLIEHMQPSWMESDRSQHRYRLIFGLIFSLMSGLIFLDFSRSSVWLVNGLINALILGLIFEVNNKFISAFIFGLISILFDMLFFKLIYGSSSKLIPALTIVIIHGFLSGVIFDLISDLIKIEPVESFQVLMTNAVKKESIKIIKTWLIGGLIVGLSTGFIIGMMNRLLFAEGFSIQFDFWEFKIISSWELWPIIGLISGLITGLIGGLTAGLIVGMHQELTVRSRPNQGIWNSLQSQVWTTIIVIFAFIPFSRTRFFLIPFSFILFIALFFGFVLGGGKACLQHLSLRIVLWQSGLPWNFARFLNYCVERRLLLRVGGSYRFLHRELLDHFAQPNR